VKLPGVLIRSFRNVHKPFSHICHLLPDTCSLPLFRNVKQVIE
jgi:hypothetical protein